MIKVMIFVWLVMIAASGFGEPMPYNLINNGFMNKLNSEGTIPTGYTSRGVTIEAVHPFTSAFEGPYKDSKPSGAVDDPDLATKENPYYFGKYNMGPRISRGGMSAGWAGRRDGNILKISGTLLKDGMQYQQLKLPFNNPIVNGGKFYFSAWVKIVKGSHICIGTDAGYPHADGNVTRGKTLYKATTDTGAQGWYKWEIEVGISQTTQLTGNQGAMGFEAEGNEGEIEIYLALPYAKLIENGKTWMQSVGDVVDSKLSGRIGIGTSQPDYSLDVQGQIRAKNNDHQILIYDNDTQANEWSITTYNDSGLSFFEDVSNPRLTILSGGNVGIGTTNPQSELSVNGKIIAKEIDIIATVNASEVKVKNVAWSDYVFEDDYKLKSLPATESYIKANKHLPGIPSEQEVKENGVNIGEMQAKLLAKIEELTLHLIEQNKLIKAQNKRIEQLEQASNSNLLR